MNLHLTFEFLVSASAKKTKCVMPAINFRKRNTKIGHFCLRSPKYAQLGHFTMLFCKGRLRNVQRSSRCRCASRAQFLVTNALLWTVKSPTCPVQLAIFFCHSDHMKKAKSDNWTFLFLERYWLILNCLSRLQLFTVCQNSGACIDMMFWMPWWTDLFSRKNSHHQMEHTNVDVNRGHVKA